MPKAGGRRAKKKANVTADARIAAWPSTRDRLARISIQSNEEMAQIADWIIRDLWNRFDKCKDKSKFFAGRELTKNLKD